MDLLAAIDTPLGDKLVFQRMTGTEALSQPFEYRVELLSEDSDIDFNEMLGQSVTVKLQLPDDVRRFNGRVARFGLTGRQGRFYTYQATVRPWLWFLTRTQDCRIFQGKTVVEIIKEVFHDHSIASFEERLTGSYTPWEYCVQYRETDFNFVSRLLEQEGIYYFFKHEDDRHTLVLCDAPGAHDPCEGGYDKISYRATSIEGGGGESIRSWFVSDEVQPGAVEITDYDSERPNVKLTQRRAMARQHELSEYEVFDYPGEYVKEADGDHYVRTRLEELQSRHHEASGSTDARGLACGFSFELEGFPRGNQDAKYIVGATQIGIVQAAFEGEGGGGSRFDCSFKAISAGAAFRPQRSTPKPVVQGPQTAIVVGQSGDEIYTDKQGRVKVQFHWDRYGKKDENSSCWVRVSSPWAGKGFGFVAHPRIGQEVIVDFLEGDPDQPIITGRVYNAEQLPPWPDNPTRTGIVTRSTKEGDASTANELRFEDMKGEEEVFLHAERDLRTTVQADEHREVGNDRTTLVKRNEKLDVEGWRTTTIKGDETLTVSEGNRSMTVTLGTNTEEVQGDETLTVHGSRTVTIDLGETRTINAGGLSETITGPVGQIITGSYEQTATQGMEHSTPLAIGFTAGTTFDVVATAGVNISTPAIITLKGTKVDIDTPLHWENTAVALANVGAKQENVGAVQANTGVAVEVKGVELTAKGFARDKEVFFEKEAATNVTNIAIQMNTLNVQMTKSTIVIIA